MTTPAPIVVALGADLAARVDRLKHPTHPARVTLLRDGKPVLALPWHEMQAAYGQLSRAIQGKTPARPGRS